MKCNYFQQATSAPLEIPPSAGQSASPLASAFMSKARAFGLMLLPLLLTDTNNSANAMPQENPSVGAQHNHDRLFGGHSFLKERLSPAARAAAALNIMQTNLLQRSEFIFIEVKEHQTLKELIAIADQTPCSESDCELITAALWSAYKIISENEKSVEIENNREYSYSQIRALAYNIPRGLPVDPFISLNSNVEDAVSEPLAQEIATSLIKDLQQKVQLSREHLAEIVKLKEHYQTISEGPAGLFHKSTEMSRSLMLVESYIENQNLLKIQTAQNVAMEKLKVTTTPENNCRISNILPDLLQIHSNIQLDDNLINFIQDYNSLINCKWFETLPTKSKNALIDAVYLRKEEDPERRPVLLIQSLLDSELNESQRQQVLALYADISNRETFKSLLHYLEDLVLLNRSSELFSADTAGGNLLGNLRKLAVAKLNPNLEKCRSELLEKCAAGLNSIASITQMDANACATLPAEAALFGLYPAEAARITFGLASKKGVVVLPKGHVLYAEDIGADKSSRDKVNALVQSAFLELANGDNDYVVENDSHQDPKTNEFRGTGLIISESRLLMEAVFGLDFIATFKIDVGSDEIIERLKSNKFPIASVSLEWDDRPSNHMLMFLGFGPDGRVYLRNSHGYEGKNGTSLSNPPRIIEDQVTGVFSMSAEDFAKQIYAAITLPEKNCPSNVSFPEFKIK